MTPTLRSCSLIAASVCGILILLAVAREEIVNIIVPGDRKEVDIIAIIDIGHGGRDPGAAVSVRQPSSQVTGRTLYEHAIAYDIGIRLLRSLRQEKGTEVISTLVVPKDAVPQDVSVPRLPLLCALSTDPPSDLNEISTQTAVNLRWMLANAVLRKMKERKGPRPVIAFVSIHVDVRAQGLGPGIAVFVPPLVAGLPDLGQTQEYSRYREGREHLASAPLLVPGNHQESSRLLASVLTRSFSANGIEIHGNHQGFVGGEQGTAPPAVLNYNRIPNRVLLEVGNLRDPTDQRNLTNPTYRQRVADAISRGLWEFRTASGNADGKAVAAASSADMQHGSE